MNHSQLNVCHRTGFYTVLGFTLFSMLIGTPIWAIDDFFGCCAFAFCAYVMGFMAGVAMVGVDLFVGDLKRWSRRD